MRNRPNICEILSKPKVPVLSRSVPRSGGEDPHWCERKLSNKNIKNPPQKNPITFSSRLGKMVLNIYIFKPEVKNPFSTLNYFRITQQHLICLYNLGTRTPQLYKRSCQMVIMSSLFLAKG